MEKKYKTYTDPKVEKETKTLRREIKKERKDLDAEVYSKEDVDSNKTKLKRAKR